MEYSRPRVVQLTITSKCQCKCKHCGVCFLKNHSELTFTEIKTIFNNLKTAGTEIIDLFGGEPTLRNDLSEIITLGKDIGFSMLLETNALLLSEAYVLKLKAAGIDRIFISLDHFLPEKHDEIRGISGIFNNATNAIMFCKKHNVPVYTTIVPPNEDFFKSGDMNTYLDYCLSLGVKKVRILLPRYIGSAKLTKHSCFVDNAPTMVNYIDKEFLPFIFFHSEDTPINNIEQCSAKKYFCHITTSGDLMPCPYLPIIYGNVKKESIHTIIQRLKDSKYLKLSGNTCLARNIDFINTYLSKIDDAHPYYHEINGILELQKKNEQPVI